MSALGRTPVLLVGGIDETAMMATTLSLQFGLPGAVVVRHVIDAARGVLKRVVSDVGGVIEAEEVDLDHACVPCAVREDIVPTLERLAAQGRWGSIIGCLPVAAEAVQVCRAIGQAPRNAPHVTVAAVVTALDGRTVAEDLLGSDLLAERGLEAGPDDRRGAGEVACAMVEYADVVCLTEPAAAEEAALIAALARPGTALVEEPSLLDAAGVVGVHRHHAVEAWVATVRRKELPPLAADGAWRLDLRSDRPLHPLRFQDELAVLGSGPRRSRGCFWLPTRPRDVCVWDGAGGQVSIGATQAWGPGKAPLTRIVITGLDDADREHAAISEAFGRCLLSHQEIAVRGSVWAEVWDGLEPWLGPIDQVA